jgi:hypothetical protein
MEKHILAEHALECYYCYLRFDNFAILADHVKRAHTQELDGEVLDIRYKLEVWNPDDPFNLELRGEEMLQKSKNAGQKSSFTGSKTRWVKDEDCGKVGTENKFKILDAQEGKGGESVIVKIEMHGAKMYDTWRDKNPNFDIAIEALGADPTKWKGKSGIMFLEYEEFAERNWRRVKF